MKYIKKIVLSKMQRSMSLIDMYTSTSTDSTAVPTSVP